MKDIIKELGLEELAQEDRDQILIQLTDSLLKRLVLRVYDRLGEEDQKEFDKLTEAGDPVAIDSFLKTKIPDLDEVKDRELEELVSEMKEFLAAAKK